MLGYGMRSADDVLKQRLEEGCYVNATLERGQHELTRLDGDGDSLVIR